MVVLLFLRKQSFEKIAKFIEKRQVYTWNFFIERKLSQMPVSVQFLSEQFFHRKKLGASFCRKDDNLFFAASVRSS